MILGLGNPGPRYELTRHNAGFWVVDNLAEKYNIRLERHKYFSLYGKGEVEGLAVVIAKPMTYMNESGKAAKSLLSAFNLSPEQLLVIHDDIDLPLGRIKKSSKGAMVGNWEFDQRFNPYGPGNLRGFVWELAGPKIKTILSIMCCPHLMKKIRVC